MTTVSLDYLLGKSMSDKIVTQIVTHIVYLRDSRALQLRVAGNSEIAEKQMPPVQRNPGSTPTTSDTDTVRRRRLDDSIARVV